MKFQDSSTSSASWMRGANNQDGRAKDQGHPEPQAEVGDHVGVVRLVPVGPVPAVGAGVMALHRRPITGMVPFVLLHSKAS